MGGVARVAELLGQPCAGGVQEEVARVALVGFAGAGSPAAAAKTHRLLYIRELERGGGGSDGRLCYLLGSLFPSALALFSHHTNAMPISTIRIR